MENLLKVLILFFLLACSHTPQNSTQIETKDTPDWVYSPGTACPSFKICASGEGKNFAQADSNARKSLASIFKTKIQSELKYSKQDFSGEEISKIKESLSEEVNQQIDDVLKGASVKERFTKDGLVFSLVTLDKNSSFKLLYQELTRLDNEMAHYYELKSKLYLKKLLILYHKREVLNEKLLLVNGSGVPRKITFDQIRAIKYQVSTQNLLKVIAEDDVPQLLTKKIEELLTDVGYSMTAKDDQDYQVLIRFEKEKEYMNVKGFEKFSFDLKLKALDKNSKTVGNYTVNLTSQGRNEKDALKKIYAKFLSEIEENIEKLNLK